MLTQPVLGLQLHSSWPMDSVHLFAVTDVNLGPLEGGLSVYHCLSPKHSPCCRLAILATTHMCADYSWERTNISSFVALRLPCYGCNVTLMFCGSPLTEALNEACLERRLKNLEDRIVASLCYQIAMKINLLQKSVAWFGYPRYSFLPKHKWKSAVWTEDVPDWNRFYNSVPYRCEKAVMMTKSRSLLHSGYTYCLQFRAGSLFRTLVFRVSLCSSSAAAEHDRYCFKAAPCCALLRIIFTHAAAAAHTWLSPHTLTFKIRCSSDSSLPKFDSLMENLHKWSLTYMWTALGNGSVRSQISEMSHNERVIQKDLILQIAESSSHATRRRHARDKRVERYVATGRWTETAAAACSTPLSVFVSKEVSLSLQRHPPVLDCCILLFVHSH